MKYVTRIRSSLCSILLLVCSVMVTASPEQVQQMIAEGNLDGALKFTNEQLASDADNVSYLFLKGLILTRQDKLELARDIFIVLTEQHPELPEPYNNLAVVYAALGDFDSARTALEKAINTHPSYATAHENLGDIYAKLASQAYNQALELDKDNSTARAKLALVDDLLPVPSAQAEVVTTQTATRPAHQQVETSVPAVAQAPTVEQVASTPPTAPLAKPVAVKQPTQPKSDDSARLREQQEARTVAAIKQNVLSWARDWSSQDVPAYLGHYAEDFSPSGSQTLSQWRESRAVRLTSPASIQVDISDLVVALLGTDHAQATFTQVYQSDTFSDRVKKTLLFKIQDGNWLITQELTR